MVTLILGLNLLKFQVNLTRLPLRPVISLGMGKAQGTIPDRIPLHGRERVSRRNLGTNH